MNKEMLEQMDEMRGEAARGAGVKEVKREFTTKEVLQLAEQVRDLNEVRQQYNVPS